MYNNKDLINVCLKQIVMTLMSQILVYINLIFDDLFLFYLAVPVQEIKY